MEKRVVGKSGIEISVMGIGGWSYGGGDYWGPQAQEDVDAVAHAALDNGINFFDTAEGYNEGRSEEAVGRALKGRRSEAIIATKISPNNTEPTVLREHCDASLRRLQTDYIDIYIVHWPITEHSVEDAFATLNALKGGGQDPINWCQQLWRSATVRSPVHRRSDRCESALLQSAVTGN